MRNQIVPRSCRLLCLSVLCLATISMVRAEAPATPAPPKLSGPPKVRVFVRENSVATAVGGSTAASPAPAAGAGKGAKGTPANAARVAASPNAAQAAASELDAEKFTRTTRKTLTLTLTNLTTAPLDVTVKATFLAKDEAGKHEVVEEKTVEKNVTLQPGKGDEFTTEEVSFTHTAAHHAPIKKGGGGAGAAAGGAARGGVSSMIPASGHAYFGYRVEVFQGQELVGMTATETH